MTKFIEEEMTLAKELGVSQRFVCIVGSTLICGAGNDIDFLCLVPGIDLEELGFLPDIEASYESPLQSFRRGSQNLIAVTDASFFFAEVAIAHAARIVAAEEFDMSNRDDRIRFHHAVRCEVLTRMSEAF